MIEKKNFKGETPIYIAVTKGYLDVVSILVEAGAEVNFVFGDLAVNKCTRIVFKI